MITGTRYQLTREVNRQMLLASEIARAQAEISAGGKRILAPSDDPIGAARVADITRTQTNAATWKGNLNTAAALSSNAEGVLDSMVSAFDRVNELMLGASNGTLSAENRLAAALEIESIAAEIATLRDTRDSRGALLFPPASQSIAIPVGENLDISAVASSEAVFNLTTSAGTFSLTGILGDAVTALRANDPAAIAASLAMTNTASSRTIANHAEQGARGARIDALADRLVTNEIGLKEERSGIEDANLNELLATISAKKLSLDAAQAVFARVNSSTLFDLLR
jgi:flagellar hook-associated protein 3 FlgL